MDEGRMQYMHKDADWGRCLTWSARKSREETSSGMSALYLHPPQSSLRVGSALHIFATSL